MLSNMKLGPDKVGLTSPRNQRKLRVSLKQPTDKNGQQQPSTCQRWRERLGGANAASNVGTCLVVFAVPLLIPGVTLTAVAFDDETGFAKYGALHVLGMAMLCLAGLLIVAGILLNVSFNNEVGPEDAPRSISTHEKSGNDMSKNIEGGHHPQGDKCQPETDGGNSGGASSHQPISNKHHHVNFIVEAGHDLQHENHAHVLNKEGAEGVGALPSMRGTQSKLRQPAPSSLAGINNGYVSSSDDDDDSSLDTDNRSSGSYILPQEMDFLVSSGMQHHSSERVNDKFDDSHLLAVPREYGGYFKDSKDVVSHVDCLSRHGPMTASHDSVSSAIKNNDMSSSYSIPQPSNNFFQREDVKRPSHLSLGSTTASRKARKTHRIAVERARVISAPAASQKAEHGSVTSLKKEVGQMASPPQQNSPRARLGGFSNTSALATSLRMSNSDELLPKHLGIESFGSNTSVFSNVEKDDNNDDDDDDHDEEKEEEEREDLNGPYSEPILDNSRQLSPRITKTFSFDVVTPGQEGTISHETGRVATGEDQTNAQYTTETYLNNSLHVKQKREDLKRSEFRFHAVTSAPQRTIESPTYGRRGVMRDARNSSRSSPVPLKSKKRQAFSFPQGGSSSPPSLPHSVRQSAPPSLFVTAHGSQCV